MNNLRVAITGSSGFLGKNYLNSAKHLFAEFFAISREEILYFDYSKVDVVVHFAAIAHKKNVKKEDYYSINRDLTICLAEYVKSKGVKHFIFLSSSKVYSIELSKNTPIKLLTLPDPKDDYGKSKLEAENGLKKIESENFCISIIRLPLVYGPGVKANMLGLLNLIYNTRFLPFGNAMNLRSYIFTENLFAFINKLIDKRESGIFLVSDGMPVSTFQLVKTISEKMNKRLMLFKLPLVIKKILKYFFASFYSKLWGNFIVDSSESFEMIDFTPTFTFDQGINEMVNWYLETKKINFKV